MFVFFALTYSLHVENLCISGESQSPIDIQDYLDAKYYKLELRFKDDRLVGKLANNSFIFTEDPTKEIPEFRILGSDAKGLMVGYKPVEFRIVIPAEHKIEGRAFDAELQIWGDLLNIYKNPYVRGCLSIFFAVGENSTKTFLLEEGQLTLNMEEIAEELKQFNRYFTYRGSDWTQECLEDVNRFLIPNALSITQEQLDQLAVSGTTREARPLQEVRRRPIKRGTMTIFDQTSGHFHAIDRYISLAFIVLLFAIIFALFIKEQRQKSEQARKAKQNL